MNVSQRSIERKSGVIKINKKKFAEFAKAKGLKIREYDTEGGGLKRKNYGDPDRDLINNTNKEEV